MEANEEISAELSDEGGIGSRLARALGRGGQAVRRTSDVLTGADIRRFDEFTDAVTRVTVGLHRDQGELREQVNNLEQSLSESRQAQAVQAEQLAAVEQTLAAHLERNRRGIWERIWRMLTLRA